MIITILWIIILAILLAVSSVTSQLRLLMRRLTSVAERGLFQVNRESRFQPDKERVGISLSALHGAAMALFAVGLTGLLVLGRPDHFWGNLGSAMLLILGAIIVCDQFIPFLLVARHDEPEIILARWLPVLRVSVFLALPLTFPVLISTSIARLLETPEEKQEAPNPQEELQELIEVGQQEGTIEKTEGELLQSVVEFGGKVVHEVMTPRPEIAAVEINSSLEDLRKLVKERRQSRYPVYSGQLDHIEGIVSIQNLFELPAEEQAKVTLRSLVGPVHFVPESKPVHTLLKELQQSTTQLAIVIDEYGSVSGLVTIEDLVEEIVGEIRDEVEPHARDIVKESANTYLVAGHTELAQIADRFQVRLEGNGYSTVAGLLLANLGHVPTRGEAVEINGLRFEVLEANERSVLKVRLALPTAAPASAPTHAKPGAH